VPSIEEITAISAGRNSKRQIYRYSFVTAIKTEEIYFEGNEKRLTFLCS
jgi:hypothetical protein